MRGEFLIPPVTNRSIRPLPDPYRKLASHFGTATAALGLLGLSGWILGIPLLASIRSSYIPMAPFTAIAFLCLGGLLLVYMRGAQKGPAGMLVALGSAVLSGYGMIELVEYLGLPVLSLEERMFPGPPIIGAIPTGRMSPTTAALLFLSGMVVPMLFLREQGGERRKLYGDLAGCLGCLSAVIGTVFVLSYLHGAPLLYGTSTIPMAATTALAYLFLGTGHLLAVGPDGFPSRLFAGPSTRARLLRVFVSTTIGVVVAIDLLHVYAHRIFFDDTAFISGVSTTAFLVIAGALIASVSLKVGDDMDRSEEFRRRAEDKLRESEDRFRDLVEHSQDLVCTHDLEGRILSVNPWAATVLGYAPEELLRMNFHELLVPEMHQGFETYLNEIRTHGAAQGRMLVRTRKGERLLWEYKNTLRTEGVEKPIVRGMAHDITERKRAEEEIRSLAKFPSENPDPIMRIATDGTLLYINEVGSRHLSDWQLQAGRIVPPMLRDTVSRAMNLGSRQVFDLEHNESVYSFNVAPISDAGYANLYGRDITEHKRAEQTQMRLLAMLDATPGFVGFADAKDTHILYINPAGRKMVGLQAQEDVTRLKIADVHPEWTNKLFRDEIIPSALRDGMWTGECAFLNQDGRETPVMMVLLAHKSPSGEVERFSTISIDITERKHAEAEKEMLQVQFLQAQKMEAVGRLAGGVAHDFNNLLTVITGYSEILLQKVGKESPMHGEVEEIQRAGERAASLTQQLLAFSRKQVIEPKVLDLNHLTADLGKMLIRLIGENIDLKTLHGKCLGLIKVDSGQFEQVLINLAVNGRDAMPDGGTLLVETANVELDEAYCAQRPYEIYPGRYVMLAVSDTGHGMAEDTRKQIFDPFFTTKAKGKGTGLGLSMVYGAVKQSGGSIEAYSEVGIGTTFKIYLPRVEGDAVNPGEDERSAVLPGGTETVLVVEDEDIVRNLGVRILERFGYKVIQARNGDEAISLAAGYGERIDLLLTDVVMPGMNGSELATQLVLHHPEMEILFTSGYTDDTITRHGVLDEGVSFVGKPYTPSALARKVREVLDKA